MRLAILHVGGRTKQLVRQVWRSRENMRLKLKFGKTNEQLVEYLGKVAIADKTGYIG